MLYAPVGTSSVLLDEAIVAISQKVDDLLAAGTPVQLTALSHPTLPIYASSGTVSIGTIDRQSDFENGFLRLELATGRVEPVDLRPGADEEPVF